MPVTRRHVHVDQGWYSGDKAELDAQLGGWLREAAGSVKDTSAVRAIIAPHAGYSYSGPTAAYAYAHVPTAAGISRVFILGPSHHVHLSECALSEATQCATPLGTLPVDTAVVAELSKTGAFDVIDVGTDEDEHSLEMHMPYVRKVFEGQDIKIVPIMVGATSPRTEARFGKLLAPYLDDPANFFVVSSDFCHWGSRFSYQHYDKRDGPIHEHITKLDHRGMELIEAQDPDAFREYLRETRNTICGRHPICVLLEAMKASSGAYRTAFVRYAQSSPCRRMGDSSVSYASAVVTLAGTGGASAASADAGRARAGGGAGGASGPS